VPGVTQFGFAIRWILLGADESFGARFGCGRNSIAALAFIGLVFHAIDLLTGIRMMQEYGLNTEQNPLARTLFSITGPVGLAMVKFGVVGGGILLLVWLARRGRPRLARNALILVAVLGLLGFSSNLI
jgi:hypothetical protein